MRIVQVLQDNDHTVGFLGDGMNDLPAITAADVGISVDTAAESVRECADVLLLKKDLNVLEAGILEGRKAFANMTKYIKITASSNFGNMFSVLAASALLPFLPMMSIHLILLNLIYDLSCTAIPWDHVDEEYLKVPRKWDASSVGSFMLWIGPTSSIFDFTTYIFMYFVFCPLFVSHGVLYNDLANHFSGAELTQMQIAYAALFQAGWLVESMWSQTLVIHMIRTPPNPVHPEPCVGAADAADLHRHSGADRHPVYAARCHAGFGRPAIELLCLPHPLHSALYGAGDQLEKGLCPPFRRTSVRNGGFFYELKCTLAASVRQHGPSGHQFWILGCHVHCPVHRHPDECGILDNRTQKISTKKHRTSFVRCFFYLIPAACAHRHRFRHYCPALLP